VERGDTGLGRGAYGLPRRRRLSERRAGGSRGRGAEGTVPRGTDGAIGVSGLGDDEDEEYYGQLLRRPGDLPPYQRQPGPPRARQAGRVPPPSGNPPSGNPPSGNPPSGNPPSGNPPSGNPPSGNPAAGFPRNGGPASRYPPAGNAANGAPNSGPGNDTSYTGPGSGASYSRPGGGPSYTGPGSGAADYRGPESGGSMPRRQYRLPNGRRVPPADRLYRPSGPGPAGGTDRRPGPGQAPDSDRLGGMRGRPPRPSPHSGPAGPPGPVIRQRETAVPDQQPAGPAKPVASIAPDGLESFARDLRALRAKAELDYPGMAELSHYTMRTLASAAAGLRLPTLPVAVAYVRACGGNVAEWEDRWHKLATKITADAAKRRQGDGDDQQAAAEPSESTAVPEPPAVLAGDPEPQPGEVYVITSAKPRPRSW
jgi:hypothetical protein